MNTSILIAKYIGPVMLVAAVAGLLNPKQIMIAIINAALGAFLTYKGYMA